MYYTSFRIKNFKGVKDTTISLNEQMKSGVFAFVGLNESGKTTILEAIHSFSPDPATSLVVGGDKETGLPYASRVPRHLISNFTDDVSVSADVFVSNLERREIISLLWTEHQLKVDPDSFPQIIKFERHQRFKNGDYQKSFFSLRTKIRIKTGRQKSWRTPSSEERIAIRDEIYSRTPDIAYFPTFVFDFPDAIYLTEGRGGKVNNFYRQAFQDILDFEGSGHTIEESIVRRVRSSDKVTSWLEFLNIWNSSDDKDKIQHVMDRASATVTDAVFGRWNEIFGEDVKGKEIYISYGTQEGEDTSETGVVTKTQEHDLFVKFQIKDGTRRFNVNDRSLGFRWFFSFMMFTQFRVAREGARPILFLFDEPASNLHSAAQQKLIESFPEIAREEHTLAYSTHSHYMIEPKWLEQTFIVTNRVDAPTESVIDDLSLSDESLDIQAMKYREFAGMHSNQTSYFQPILDRLEVTPSRFDFDRASIIVEGKSDYYVLRYAFKLLDIDPLPIVPGIGSSSFGGLIALSLGWCIPFIALLDGDPAGKSAREKYIDEYCLPSSNIVTLTECSDGLTVIEDLLDDEALDIVSSNLGLAKRPSKKQIRRFFQENLAKGQFIFLGENFNSSAKSLISALDSRLKEVQE